MHSMKFGVMACLLVCLLIPSNLVGADTPTLSPVFTPSDDKGPDFRGVGDTYADALQNSDVTHITLSFYVTVYDSDGISSVIGSYNEQNGTEWSNCTLDLYHVYESGWRSYVGNGTNFTLTAEYRIKIWDVKYYACDSMGNWNATDVVKYSYNLLPPPQGNPFESIPFYGTLFIIIVISMVGIAVWKKR